LAEYILPFTQHFAHPFTAKHLYCHAPLLEPFVREMGGWGLGAGDFGPGKWGFRIGIAAKSCHCLLIYIHAEILRQDTRATRMRKYLRDSLPTTCWGKSHSHPTLKETASWKGKVNEL